MDFRTKAGLTSLAVEFTETSPLNYISAALAIRPELEGMRIYDAPILGAASTGDPFFEELRRPGIVGPQFHTPRDWLPEAETVISFFLPSTATVRMANRQDPVWPSPEWLHGRIEGQLMVNALCRFLRDTLEKAGYPTVAPSLDPRFWSKASPIFNSNWSERHVAHVCGLGTFGLSAGLITQKGMAGRFGSVVTTLSLQPDTRTYQTHNEYCTLCGACVRRCPAHAISLEHGKNHTLCSAFLDKTQEKYAPRYGCGKCQVAVPCEAQIPKRADRKE